MEKRDYYKIMFFVAGIENIVAGLPLWFLGLSGSEAFALFGMTAPPSLFFFHAAMWFIVIFGIGYLMVGRDIRKNHGIAVIGVLSKAVFGIDAIAAVALAEAIPALLVFGIWDLLFAVLFAEFLLWTKKQPKA
jgi:hypothetical protein